MEIDKHLSARIQYLRFPLVVGVIFLHNASPAVRVCDYINAFLGIPRHPFAYQFLFIMHSIILVLVSPIIYKVLNGNQPYIKWRLNNDMPAKRKLNNKLTKTLSQTIIVEYTSQ